MLKGFREFIMRGNVVDLAVAVVVGTAFEAVVTSLVADLLTPLIAAIVGKPNFSGLNFVINHSRFYYGSFFDALLSFVFVASAVFLFVVLPLNKLAERRAAGNAVSAAALPPDVLVLTEIRDLLAAQSAVAPPGSAPQGPVGQAAEPSA